MPTKKKAPQLTRRNILAVLVGLAGANLVGCGSASEAVDAAADLNGNVVDGPDTDASDGGPRPSSGFTPNSSLGVTSSGTFANGQAITINLPGGGLGARSNPLPLYYWTMGEDGRNTFSTHPTLSRTQKTLTAETANTIIQNSVVPPNALGACRWIPVPAGSSSVGATAFHDSPYATFTGGAGFVLYSFWKSYHGMATLPDNDKMWRLWPSAGLGGNPDGYFTHSGAANGDHILTIESHDNANNLPPQYFGHFIPFAQTTRTWDTYEIFWKENSYGNSDGIFNAARNAQLAYPLTTTYGPCNANNGFGPNPSGVGPMTLLFLDEYTHNIPGTNTPNGTTDFHVYGIIYFDDSNLQLIVTDEGSTYQTSGPWNRSGVDHQREIQIQTARSNTSVTATLRQGAHSKGTPYWVHAITGYGTSILLGTGVWQ